MTEQSVVLHNFSIARDIYQMDLTCSFTDQIHPGQFVMVQVPGFYLRRPISIAAVDHKEGTITLVYKILGSGTEKMAGMKAGEKLDLFGPLGHGFPIEQRESVLLAGGGVGVPPLYETARWYRKQGSAVNVVLGFNTLEDLFFEEAFQKLGCSVYIATMDGSFGTRGTVLDAIRENHLSSDFVLACGPMPMLKALNTFCTDGYLSLEARMACGIGACMGCVVKAADGTSLRVCKDGPVFSFGKVVL